MQLKWIRIIMVLVACILLGVSAFIYAQMQLLGFPDGFISESERVEQWLAQIYIWVSIPIAVWFAFLGLFASQQQVLKQWRAMLIVYALFALLLIAVDLYLRYTLSA